MSKAIYPGSFDPVTNGHLDIVKRALKVFDGLLIAVTDNPGKRPLFSKAERVALIKQVAKMRGVEVAEFDGLLVEYVKKRKMPVILRGIRTMSDFEVEFQMALTNRAMAPDIETVFIMTHEEYSYISSRLVKEAAMFGGDVTSFVPPSVEKALREKYKTIPPPPPSSSDALGKAP